jgi:hypothetical protein
MLGEGGFEGVIEEHREEEREEVKLRNCHWK